jgi:hypothetical protein
MVIELTEADTSELVEVEAPVKSGVGPEELPLELLQPASTVRMEHARIEHAATALAEALLCVKCSIRLESPL